ncbi:MAG: GAF domain-containing sensor histidine kinase [Candidatus Marinimicrobia bacterium]|nr:GAF domain-containing sensor histidine kinase [Candidatus Neomarinimicrobiota bacterium]
MDNSRLDELIIALEEMIRGNYHPELTIKGSNEYGKLARAISAVGESFENRCKEQQTLASITEKINDGLLLTDVLDHVFESFRELISYNRIGIALIDTEKGLVRACCTRSDAKIIKISNGYSAPIAGSSLATIIDTNKPRILNNLSNYLNSHPDSVSTRLIVEEGMQSSLTCPLIAANKPVGFIFFSSVGINTYKNLHVEIFQKIARQLSVIFEKSRMVEELIQLNDLKNKFLGIAAHDLRSPIGVVKNFIILFLNGYLGEIDEKQREVLNTMDKNCDRMLNLIHNILDFSAIESGNLELKLESLDLHKFFHTYQSMIKSLAEKKQIELKLVIESELPEITVDSNRIMQVLDNLVTNAIKFSFPNTTVTISARKSDGSVEISVADQGQGIPENEISKIFKEFSKTSVRPTGGEKSTGLGLAIVRRIIEAHNGSINVNSIVGKGTTFTIILPINTK